MRKPTARQRKAAELLAHADKPIRTALMEAGYSRNTAELGRAGIPATVLALMPKESNLVDLGKILDASDQEALVRGRLVLNVIQGKDSAVSSAYRLGQDKRVNMFQPELQQGIVILNAPGQVATAPASLELPPEDE